MVLENVTGWNELMNGQVVTASFMALNDPWGGYLIFVLYVLISAVLWSRTGSVELVTIMNLLFLGSFLVFPWFNAVTMGLSIIIFAFLLSATLYKFFVKEGAN